MGWLIFEGNEGIDPLLDREKNNRHKGDEFLVPFTTKNNMNRYEDFSGVVGAFSRLMSGTEIKNDLTQEEVKERIRVKTDCGEEDLEKLFRIVKDLYFDEDKIVPINIKSLCLLESNVTQRQVAGYLYALFIEATDLKEQYQQMTDAEDTNVFEKLLFDIFEDKKTEEKKTIQKAECFLPYVKEMFQKDFAALIQNTDAFKSYIQRFLAYYYMFYISQLAVKLWKFDQGDRNEIEKIYMTLNWEGISKVRPGYEYGWKYVTERLGHMFSHSCAMYLLSHNIEDRHYDYIGLRQRFEGTSEDEEAAREIREVCRKYENWIPMDYENCIHKSPDSPCKASREAERLFETIDYQFLNGGRGSHYNGYIKKFIEFVRKNFGKRRGTLGYTVGVNENDIVMFTRIILQENSGRIRLSALFDEFDKRGLIFDRGSKKKVTELFEKMNLLEKRSDSGDAQYVKYVL